MEIRLRLWVQRGYNAQEQRVGDLPLVAINLDQLSSIAVIARSTTDEFRNRYQQFSGSIAGDRLLINIHISQFEGRPNLLSVR